MSKRKLELIDALGKHDAALTEARGLLDNHARGRRYKDMAAVGEGLATVAKAAAAAQQELDKLLTDEWEKRQGRG